MLPGGSGGPHSPSPCPLPSRGEGRVRGVRSERSHHHTSHPPSTGEGLAIPLPSRGEGRVKGVGLESGHHHTSHPPSTVTDCPVMFLDSSETRKSTALAMSCDTVTRRSAISSTYSW